MHHVNLYEAQTGVVLKEHRVAEKEGELTRGDAFLTFLLLAGRVLSTDALYTQKHVCQQIIASGGDYLLFCYDSTASECDGIAARVGGAELSTSV